MLSRTFPLSELISDCGGLLSMKGPVANITFPKLENAHRFSSLVNQVDPPHQGCSISYHDHYAVAVVELSPGQFARTEPTEPVMFWGDDTDVDEAVDALAAMLVTQGVRMMISASDTPTDDAEWTTIDSARTIIDGAKIERATIDTTDAAAIASPKFHRGGVVRAVAGDGLLIFDKDGHAVVTAGPINPRG